MEGNVKAQEGMVMAWNGADCCPYSDKGLWSRFYWSRKGHGQKKNNIYFVVLVKQRLDV